MLQPGSPLSYRTGQFAACHVQYRTVLYFRECLRKLCPSPTWFFTGLLYYGQIKFSIQGNHMTRLDLQCRPVMKVGAENILAVPPGSNLNEAANPPSQSAYLPPHSRTLQPHNLDG
jgi:hypothetical protein